MPSDPVSRHMAAELRNLARLAAQWADVLDADLSDPSTPEAARESGKPGIGTFAGNSRASEPTADANRPPPVIFSCAMCGNRTVWDVAGYARPWPNALCGRCYAEMRMRRDAIQDTVVGYTGVR